MNKEKIGWTGEVPADIISALHKHLRIRQKYLSASPTKQSLAFFPSNHLLHAFTTTILTTRAHTRRSRWKDAYILRKISLGRKQREVGTGCAAK